MAKISIPLYFFLILLAFGLVNGSLAMEKIGIYELKKGNFSVKLTNWGAYILFLVVPEKSGKLADIVLGFDSVNDYINSSSPFRAIVGRVANRICGAAFTLNGTCYNLVANAGKNTIHGGPRGFSRVSWKVKRHEQESANPSIQFSYHSFDGEGGFPGDMLVTVMYTLTGNKQLIVTMKTIALNKPTLVNLAQNAFWNLGGHNCSDILHHYIRIFKSRITPVNSQLIPTGKIAPVKQTPYDFSSPQTIKSRIKKLPTGYDINYVLNGYKGDRVLKKAAVMHEKKSGRVLEL